jgi:glycosyltransferase involved in cell wall biosynthesis
MDPLPVAFDVGPLAGHRSGIGHAVAALHRALGERTDVDLIDFRIGLRGPFDGVRRLPLPPGVALRAWALQRHPRMDRQVHPAVVVHGTNYVVPPTRRPSVVSVHDTWFLRNPERSTPLVRRVDAVLRRAVRSGTVVHTSSRATADMLGALLPGTEVHVVPHGPLEVPDAPARSPIPTVGTRPFVVAIGTLERRKNLPRLIEAFAAVAAIEPDPVLVLAGKEGDDREAIDAAIDAAGPDVAARVLLAGPVDSAARAWLLRHAAVLAFPSLDEGFGFPLLDAMQVGVPVVAADAGSIGEVAGDAALLCAPDDVDELARHLHLALTDSETRTRLVAAGDRRWRQFSWVETAEQMTALYRQLAERRSR